MPTHTRTGMAEGAAMAVAAVAAAVTYGIYAVHPWQGYTPLNQFLAAFGRADTTAWPMQIVWYAAAVAMVGLALWPVRRSAGGLLPHPDQGPDLARVFRHVVRRIGPPLRNVDQAGIQQLETVEETQNVGP